MTRKYVTRIENPPVLTLRTLTAVWWAFWFAIQWCRIFGRGDQGLLSAMQAPTLVAAVLCSILCFIRWSWEETERKNKEKGEIDPGD